MLLKATAIEPVTIVPYRARSETDTWRPMEIEVEIREEDPSSIPVVARIGTGGAAVPVRLGPAGYIAPAGTSGTCPLPSEGFFSAWQERELRAAAPDLWRLKGSSDYGAYVREARLHALRGGRDRIVGSDRRGADQYAAWLVRNLVSIEGVVHAPRIPPALRVGDAYGRAMLSTTTVSASSTAGHDWFFGSFAPLGDWDADDPKTPPHEIVDRCAVSGFDFDGWRLRQGCVSLVNWMSEVHGDGRSRLSRMRPETIAAYAALRDSLLSEAGLDVVHAAVAALASVGGPITPTSLPPAPFAADAANVSKDKGAFR